jgi:hypothetical protein
VGRQNILFQKTVHRHYNFPTLPARKKRHIFRGGKNLLDNRCNPSRYSRQRRSTGVVAPFFSMFFASICCGANKPTVTVERRTIFRVGSRVNLCYWLVTVRIRCVPTKLHPCFKIGQARRARRIGRSTKAQKKKKILAGKVRTGRGSHGRVTGMPRLVAATNANV